MAPPDSSERRDRDEVDAAVRELVERSVRKSKRSDKVIGLVATFIVAGSIGAIGFAVSYSARQDIVRVERETRKDLARSERALCHRVLDDRLSAIRLREVQVRSARAVANDPFQSAKTRRARRTEAKELQSSMDDLRTRANPANGGTLVCENEFPEPRVP